MIGKGIFFGMVSSLILSCSLSKEPEVDLTANPTELELFGEGFISTSLFERDIAIAPDGKEIIYTLGNFNQSLRCLVSVKKTGESWEEARILPFSGRFNDIEPFFSTDGATLYFASNRPMDTDTTRTDYNIWAVNRTAKGWGIPSPIDTLINSKADEFYPSVSANGNLYYTTTREEGKGNEDIFLSRLIDGEYSSPMALDSAINTKAYEFNAYITPEEDLIIFSSFGREDGYGGGDLYYSKKDENGNWKKARNMGGAINSNGLDYCPFLDLTRGNFYFSSDRTKANDVGFRTVDELKDSAYGILNGMGNIYRIGLKQLDLK